MKSILFLTVLLATCLPASGKSLCNSEDKMLFSCEIGNKNVSACLTPSTTIKYLYGNKDKVELSLNSPFFSSTVCPGGGISRLRFQNGNYSYIVYDVMCNASSIGDGQWSKSDFAGLIVLNRDKVVVNADCTDFEDHVLGVNSSLLPGNVEREEFNYEIP
ncbi:hypothetical protein [Gallaecimonas xiamenensis]|uniref:hypothetical protein n=1 Tax=Gallaecimonas xiamenensis TaxID=1207039 RepID=UPI001ED9BFB3|nr:hypothetical protein [Gallaecimonas xiamenensis]